MQQPAGQSIEPEMTIFEITERYPETVAVLVDSGFSRMRDPQLRRAQGRQLTLRAAAQLRRLDLDPLLERLQRAAARSHRATDVTLAAPSDQVQLLPEGDLRVSGLLPCPVRIPLLEAVGALAGTLRAERGTRLGFSLSAASVGADQLNRQIAAVERAEALPEVFVSAGFDSFFDQRTLRRFKDRGVFVDRSPWRAGAGPANPSFDGLQVVDPGGHFTLLAVVPAVFLVNHGVLGDAAPPRSWEELLEPRFARRVALPVGDFDLFNGMLLTLQRRFGDDGVRALGRNMLASLHPSQTVGRFAGRATEQPAISIVPHFFSKMTLGSKGIHTVWPADGAIICPIFLLARAAAVDRSQPLLDLLMSREIAEILSHRGLFPTLHPEVDNRLPGGARFSWLGWDHIEAHDLGQLIPRLEALFRAAAGGGDEARRGDQDDQQEGQA